MHLRVTGTSFYDKPYYIGGDDGNFKIPFFCKRSLRKYQQLSLV